MLRLSQPLHALQPVRRALSIRHKHTPAKKGRIHRPSSHPLYPNPNMRPFSHGPALPSSSSTASPSPVSLFKQAYARVPIFRLAAGSFALAAVATYNIVGDDSKDQDDQKDRVEVGTFDGRGAWFTPATAPTFKYTFKGGKFGIGGEKTSLHALLTEEETEQYLKAKEKTTPINRPYNPISKIDENVLPTKIACEDRHSIDIISRAELPFLLDPLAPETSFWDLWAELKVSPDDDGMGADDVVFVSVFDGHGSSAGISDLLKKTFHPCLAWMMAWGGVEAGLPPSSNTISQSIYDAFVAWDDSVLLAPQHLVRNKIVLPGLDSFPNFPNPALVALADAPARGSAAITAVIDVKEDKLYVANLGDSRAVAGWWNPELGVWRCDILSEDHECENPAEADRVRSEHPLEEADDVVYDAGYFKRVLGSGQPSRAFGNTSFKLSTDEQDRLQRAFGNHRLIPEKPILTPPYKTAKPEIVSRSLHPESGEELKFLVLATDGLWDRMTSEEASLLLASHLNQPLSPDIPKSLLPLLHPHLSPSLPRPYPAELLPGQSGGTGRDVGEWVFEDHNSATHLIRNSLGSQGWDRDIRQKVLSMREGDGGTRVVRDDTTVVVVWFDGTRWTAPPVQAQSVNEREAKGDCDWFDIVHKIVD